MENKELTKELIVRYFSGNINEEEQQQLLEWMNEDSENKKLLFVMKDLYEASALKRFFDEEAQTEVGWIQLRKKIENKESSHSIGIPGKESLRRINYFRRYIAVLLIGVLIGSLSFYLLPGFRNGMKQGMVTQQCKVWTKSGERANIVLPDGSVVHLNACSSLSYPSDFGKNSRNVQMDGEGYFEVKTNAEIPFVVHTSNLNIKAYGTSFNVKSYADEDVVVATLVEGIVSIETDDDRNVITLKPDQVIVIPKSIIEQNRKLEYTIRTIDEKNGQNQPLQSDKPLLSLAKKEQKAVLLDRVNPELYTSWKDDRWVIRAESLESLSKKIERKYDVTINIVGGSVKRYVFSGTLKNYPLEQILEVISLNAPIQYTVKERTVIIREDKQKKEKYEKLIQSP